MSNLVKRILTGVIAIPAILLITFAGGDFFFYFTFIVLVLALYEFFSLFRVKGFNVSKYYSIPLSIAAYVFLYYNIFGPLMVFIGFSILVFSLEIFKKAHSPVNAFIITGGFVYLVIPFLLLNALTKIQISDSGINIVMIIFVLIWSCDTAAYFGGRAYGKNPLSVISPKKTTEGSVTGFIVTLIVSIILYFIFPEVLELKDFIIIGALTGIFSQIGDLFESMIKRFCDVKDSSEIIPGHGGVLDRFDSLVFVTPVIFAYMDFVL